MVSLLEAKKQIEEIFLQREDIIGVGINEDTQTLRIYINCEFTCNIDTIPKRISGFPVEVVPIPGFAPVYGGVPGYRTARYRPVPGGVSASHMSVTAGTVGAVIRDKISGNKLFLSNNHVFANTASTTNARAHVGDYIVQPGVIDASGSYEDVVATLLAWVPFNDRKMNLVDAAIALPIDQSIASQYILSNQNLDVIPIHGTSYTKTGKRVKKYSRTTDADFGVVVDTNFSVAVDYEDGVTRNFTDQILMEIKTEGGDSGSLLMDEGDNAVGLIFAGGVDNGGRFFGVANKIHNVLTMFGNGVDISDGWSVSNITDSKPVYTTDLPITISEQNLDIRPIGTSISLTSVALAGIGIMSAYAIWTGVTSPKGLNIRKG